MKIAIVEDHSVFAEFLASVCTKELKFDVVFTETNGKRAISQAEKLRPDVLLLDLSLPDIDGIEVTRRILKQSPHARILVLSAYRDLMTLQRVRDAGARGFVDKRLQNRAVLTEAIRRVASGDVYFGDESTPSNLTVTKSTHERTDQRLSEADRSILCLIGEGMSDAAIALMIGSNADDVQVRRKELMEKLGISSETELVRFAVDNGYTVPD